MSFHVPEECRLKNGPMASDKSYGNNGAFAFRLHGFKGNPAAMAIASDGMAWDHVSVQVHGMKTPSWEIMALMKDIFWDEEDCIVQFHPPKSQYVNTHDNVLHLWRPQGYVLGTPPKEMV